MFDDKNIAGMGEEFWSGQGSVDVSEADDDSLTRISLKWLKNVIGVRRSRW